MAIKAQDAVAAARALLGTPYSELDCINLIKAVIRRAPGGVAGYTTAGTNALWRSYDASSKYRDLTWRQEGIFGAQAGMLAFKRSGEDVHHVGIVAERPQCGIQRGGNRESQGAPEGGDYASSPEESSFTVIHSSSARGMVVETALDTSWSLLAIHRYIAAEGAAEVREEDGKMDVLYQAAVTTQRDPLAVRSGPGTDAAKLGSMPRGAVVDVIDDGGDWWRVRYEGMIGYASAAYLVRVAYADTVEIAPGVTAEAEDATTLVREDGTQITLIGRWHLK